MVPVESVCAAVENGNSVPGKHKASDELASIVVGDRVSCHAHLFGEDWARSIYGSLEWSTAKITGTVVRKVETDGDKDED